MKRERNEIHKRIRRRRRLLAHERNQKMARRAHIPAIVLATVAVMGLSGFVYAKSEVGAQSDLAVRAYAAEKTQTEIVVVHDGDTIWGIAERYSDGSRGLRGYVKEICALNDVEPGAIRPGQVLRIPI